MSKIEKKILQCHDVISVPKYSKTQGFRKHTCSSVTIMKEKRRSSPVRPAVPTDLVILEKNLRLITSLCVLRSYQAVMCSI
jgi:hypothetical protein